MTLGEIIELGRAATARPWEQSCGRTSEAVVATNRVYDSAEQIRYAGSPVAECETSPNCGSTEQENEANARYIAAAANHADKLAAKLLAIRELCKRDYATVGDINELLEEVETT